MNDPHSDNPSSEPERSPQTASGSSGENSAAWPASSAPTSPTLLGGGSFTDFEVKTGIALMVGLGSTVAMWWIGYLTHLPVWAHYVPGPLTLVLFCSCWVAGGFWLERAYNGSARLAAVTGVISGFFNTLVLFSFLETGADAPPRWLAVLCFVAVAAVAVTIGSLLSRRLLPTPSHAKRTALPPIGGLGVVAGCATLLVVVSGGIVTTLEEGMAVPDWPTSFEMNMFLLPLSKMVGGIYYEHAHRLFGALVGVSVMSWCIYSAVVLRVRRYLLAALALVAVSFALCKGAGMDPGPSLLATSAAALALWTGWFLVGKPNSRYAAGTILLLLLVCLQGTLGGNRVVQDPVWGREFAALHGVAGQLVLASLLTLALFGTCSWQQAAQRHFGEIPRIDRGWGRTLLVFLMLQLSLGALLRHFGDSWLLIHIMGAVLLSFVAVGVGTRAIGLHAQIKPMKMLGAILCAAVVVQFVLGFAAMAAVGQQQGRPPATTFAALIPTLHQAVGAMVLSAGCAIATWCARLFDPTQRAENEPETDAVRKAMLSSVSTVDTRS